GLLRKPPSLAINRTASRALRMESGGRRDPEVVIRKAATSSALRRNEGHRRKTQGKTHRTGFALLAGREGNRYLARDGLGFHQRPQARVVLVLEVSIPGHP